MAIGVPSALVVVFVGVNEGIIPSVVRIAHPVEHPLLGTRTMVSPAGGQTTPRQGGQISPP